MIHIQERKMQGSSAFCGYNGIWLDLDDQYEQRQQLYAQMMGWA